MGGLQKDGWSVFHRLRVSAHSGMVLEHSDFDSSSCIVSVMWHVGTLLRFSDAQQERRKRHIGNDVVVVVFRDLYGTRTKFIPDFASQFNHVFVVVQPAVVNNDGEAVSYMIQIVAKDGVIPFEPFIPCNPFYRHLPKRK